MRALALDFERKAPGARIGYGLVVAGGLMAVLAVGAQSMVHAQIVRYRDAALEAGRGREQAVLPRDAASEREAIDGARAVVAHLAGPWEALFRALETIKKPDVALLALTPDIQERKIRIYAEAKSFRAMVSYYRALQQSRTFGNIVLVEHEIQHRDPQRPVRFSLLAAWGEPQ